LGELPKSLARWRKDISTIAAHDGDMTAAFGRRNRPAATSSAASAPEPGLVLTHQQRAYLFGASAPQAETDARPAVALAGAADARPLRRAGLIACAAMTAVAAALQTIGAAHQELDVLQAAVGPLGPSFAAVGRYAGPLALAWALVGNFANFSANLWLTRKLAAALEIAAPPAFAMLGAAVGLGLAGFSAMLGLEASAIGLPMEAATGAAVAGLYRLLSGEARL